ncbi:MAG: acetolactate synthase-1/2/3 large subunit [Paracoccaceae bacterium]
MQDTDVILVLNAIAPWWPDKHKPNKDVQVINIGPEPIFSRFPARNFCSDVTIAGETNLTVMALIRAMAELDTDDSVGARPSYARIWVMAEV